MSNKIAFIHGPTFTRQYEEFWLDPSKASIMWIGLVFSMACLAMVSLDSIEVDPGNDSDRRLSEANIYREKVAQCLMQGEYTRGGSLSLETLIHYVYIEFALRKEADKDIWFLLALEVNLAFRSGLHRDPSHFKTMSPLQAEMRRRVWATVLFGDVLLSSQMGMPRMISETVFDTLEPRNLNDADLDIHTTQLPPSRPESEFTSCLAMIVRTRVVLALGKAADLVVAAYPSSNDDRIRVDAILDQTRSELPMPLRMKTLAASVTDAPQVIMSRLFIDHMLHKGKLILHQRFLRMNTANEDGYEVSRDICIDASLGLLNIQQILDEETCLGGQLHMMRWRMSSIMNHQFLAATMILCSALHRDRIDHQAKRTEVLSALKKSREIWLRISPVSTEAKQAAATLNRVLAGKSDDLEEDRIAATNDTWPDPNDYSSAISDFDYVLPAFLGSNMTDDSLWMMPIDEAMNAHLDQ